MLGCTPRGGDSLALGRQLDQVTREGRFGQGWTSLYTGGLQWGMGLVVDKGFRFVPHNLGGNQLSLDEVARQHDVLVISPLMDGDPCWVYDPVADLCHQDPDITNEVGCVHIYKTT